MSGPDSAGLPRPCSSLEYAKGCGCEKCMAHQNERDRRDREKRIREANQ